MYRVKTPIWLRFFDRGKVYKASDRGNVMYFTFDDGPDRKATPEILAILDEFDAKAVFFCTGRKAVENPDLLELIRKKGHGLGNHSFSHRDGWRTATGDYLADVKKCAEVIPSNLFRPPYGRLKPAQSAALRKEGFIIVMWTLLPGDFDTKLPQEKVFQNIIRYGKSGSVIVLHDSERFLRVASFALRKSLEYFSARGFRFEALALDGNPEKTD
ncbi:MAG: polysaccharide deacetylase family protein [Bacteroidales bacterium]|nr:polysaccharide deacetylase family protein [Bacteroidales bacterium]